MEVKPFRGINIVTTKKDNVLMDTLLSEDPKDTVVCNSCGSIRFIIEAVVKMNVEVAVASIKEKTVIVTQDLDPDEIVGLRILKCASCGATNILSNNQTTPIY